MVLLKCAGPLSACRRCRELERSPETVWHIGFVFKSLEVSGKGIEHVSDNGKIDVGLVNAYDRSIDR